MIAHRSPAALLAAVLVGVGLLGGCAAPAPAPPTVAPAAPQPAAVALPWPTGRSGELQRSVDEGAQPWLLDPSEVALAYGAAAYDWAAAQAVASADGTTVDLTGPDGTRRTLTLAQPATAGPAGIWVVTADAPTP
ncbi:hypothetical protein [Pseudonocardia sp.]|uniref:hypothetical protein n=1 Tax=Pseudonocardia sp. TaxID=60912 RepID=UPI00262BD667|nr:hypothetical protein [Pseudonocardia sp.]